MKRPNLSSEENIILVVREAVAAEALTPDKKKRDATHQRVRQARLRLLSRHRQRANKVARTI